MMKAILLLGCTFSALAFVSGQIQCPARPATLNSDGTVTYSPLPSGSDLFNNSYNPGAIGGWYSLASGFVDAVRPGNLPYGQILETLNASGVQCSVGTKTNCGSASGSGFDAQDTLRSFSNWWIGLIIVTIIGGIAGIAFCVTGLCFCCCRCCGKCGGNKKQEITDNMDCKAFTFAIILLLFLLLLFVGVVLAFFSNEQTYNSLDNAQSTINTVADVGVNFINDTINEISALLCQLSSDEGVAGFVIQEAEDFNSTLRDVTNGIQRDVDMILDNVTVLNPGFNQTLDALEELGISTEATIAAGNMLNASLASIAVQVEAIRTACINNGVPASTCDTIPLGETITPGADFNQLPNTTQELNAVKSALNNIDLTSDIQQGRQDFTGIRENIETTVSDNIDAGVDELLRYNESVFNLINNLTSTVQSYISDDFNISSCPTDYLNSLSNLELNVGYLRQCVINRGFNTVQGYDVYRYAFGIIICSLSLVTVVLMLTGIIMGMVGFRKDCNPEERSGLSHCGGIFLVLGTIVTFVFGFILLILCCIFFFFGSNARKLCQAVEHPNYPVFTEIVDNSEFWNGSLLAHFIVPNDPTAEIYLSEIFRNCERNLGLYEAANLSVLIGGNVSSQIDRLANLDQIEQMLEEVLQNTTNDYNFTNTSFLPDSAQNALDEFRNASVEQINITAFREQLQNPLVSFNITETIVNLEMVRDNSALNVLPALMTLIDDVITNLTNVRDVQIPQLMSLTNELESDVNTLVNLTDNVVLNSSALLDQINNVITNITGERLPNFLEQNVQRAVSSIFGLLNSYLLHVDTQLSTNVARCEPLWFIYSEIYDTGCRNFLDGLNGFWWSLGFCALLFIPIIVFAVLTSNYFLKKKSTDELNDDYPMKSY